MEVLVAFRFLEICAALQKEIVSEIGFKHFEI